MATTMTRDECCVFILQHAGMLDLHSIGYGTCDISQFRRARYALAQMLGLTDYLKLNHENEYILNSYDADYSVLPTDADYSRWCKAQMEGVLELKGPS